MQEDVELVAGLVADVDEDARVMLDHLDRSGSEGTTQSARAQVRRADATTPVEQLLARGLLVPRDAPGVRIERLLPAMGRHDEPIGHGEVTFSDVRVPVSNILLGEGRAFEIAQGRLGPGRVHHCMRLIGLAEMALELACRRGQARTAFGKPLNNLGGNRERIADARIAIEQARLLVLHAAWRLDRGGPREALSEVSQIKVAVPRTALGVIDMAVQMHGGAGMSEDFPLAMAWVNARTLRLADGPDEVHQGLVARLELGRHR